MNEIRLTRAFLKNPLNSVFILLGVIALIEAVSWSIGYILKLQIVVDAGGPFQYVGILVSSLFIPELFTLFTIVTLINCFHSIRHIYTVENTWRSISQYELRFLPLLALSFLVFNPFTQTIRYFLESGPDYSWAEYWKEYIVHTYSWKIYFKYLFPVILIGYIALNISLLKDYLNQRREAQETAEAEGYQKALVHLAAESPKPTVFSPYLTHLKGRNTTGELDFPVNDVYYFTIEDRLYYAELAKGRYSISKTLNELEAELNPAHFLRIKRDYIVNRQAIESYTHWENGKYSIRLNTPKPHTIVIPRTRMQELREWLQQEDLQPFETVS
ncbi:LytTR family DNA-binding domain-containing protein [Spirosoma litoris]